MKTKPLTDKQFIKEVIWEFYHKTKCNAQHNKCPCNTCFHAMPRKIDYRHILWLLILGLRGDYNKDRKQILKDIRMELNLI